MIDWNEEEWLEKIDLGADLGDGEDFGEWWVCTVCDGSWRVGAASEHDDEMCPVKVASELGQKLNADLGRVKQLEVGWDADKAAREKECAELRASADRWEAACHTESVQKVEALEQCDKLRVSRDLMKDALEQIEYHEDALAAARDYWDAKAAFDDEHEEHVAQRVQLAAREKECTELRAQVSGIPRLDAWRNAIEAERDDLHRRLDATVAALRELRGAKPYEVTIQGLRRIDEALAAAQPQADAPPVTQAELQAAVDADRKPDDMAAWASKLAADITKDATIADRETHLDEDIDRDHYYHPPRRLSEDERMRFLYESARVVNDMAREQGRADAERELGGLLREAREHIYLPATLADRIDAALARKDAARK